MTGTLEQSGVGVEKRGRYTPMRNERGQALVETGLVMIALVVLFLGIIEFGRMWMVANMINHSLRDGARMAAVSPYRNNTGGVTNLDQIRTQTESEINTVLGTSTCSNCVQFTSSTQNGIPIMTSRAVIDIPFVFGLFGATLHVDRSVTFRDEGK